MYYYRMSGEKLLDFAPNESDVEDYLNSIEKIIVNNIVIDIKLFTNLLWSCNRYKCIYNATENHCGTCCDGGGIISPLDEERISFFLADTYKYLPEKKIQEIKENGFVGSRYQFSEIDKTCIFLSTLGRDYFCSLHKVANDKKLPINWVKTFDCFIEPLEIIVLNNGLKFITVVTEENVKISRWGNVLPCVTQPIINSPLLITSMKHVFTATFGLKFYNTLFEIIETRIKMENQK